MTEGGDVDFADGDVIGANRRDGLELTRSLLLGSVVDARGSFDPRHD